jgi:tRNA (uracil-5-)-methyltransferase
MSQNNGNAFTNREHNLVINLFNFDKLADNTNEQPFKKIKLETTDDEPINTEHQTIDPSITFKQEKEETIVNTHDECSSDSDSKKLKIDEESCSNDTEEQPNKPSESVQDELQGDAYLYTRTGRFTSELFKIEINNLPKYMNFVDLKKLFRNKIQINPLKLKVIRNGSKGFAFATFHNEEERTKVIEMMDGMTVKNCQLRVHKAKPMKDPYIQKKQQIDKEKNQM